MLPADDKIQRWSSDNTSSSIHQRENNNKINNAKSASCKHITLASIGLNTNTTSTIQVVKNGRQLTFYRLIHLISSHQSHPSHLISSVSSISSHLISLIHPFCMWKPCNNTKPLWKLSDTFWAGNPQITALCT